MADRFSNKFSIRSLLLCCDDNDDDENEDMDSSEYHNRVGQQLVQNNFTDNLSSSKNNDNDEDDHKWSKDEAEVQNEEEEEEEEDDCHQSPQGNADGGDLTDERLMFAIKFWWPPFSGQHTLLEGGGRVPMLWPSLFSWPQHLWTTNPLFPAGIGIVEPSSFANNSGADDDLLLPKSPIVVADERGREGQLQGQQQDDGNNIQENKMQPLHHDESSSSLTSNNNNKRIGHPYQNRQVASCKKPRTSFTKQQVSILERRFVEQKYLASSERAQLADQLGMDDAQVKTWFQNRRTKWRRQEAEERQFDKNGSSSCGAGIPSSYFFALANNAPTLSHKLKSFPM